MQHSNPLPDLVLPLKREFFEQIKCGEKPEEFRLCTPYWDKRRVTHPHFGTAPVDVYAIDVRG